MDKIVKLLVFLIESRTFLGATGMDEEYNIM